MRRSGFIALGSALAVLALSATLVCGFYRLLPPGRSLPGTLIADHVQPKQQRLGDFLEELRQRLLERPAWLVLPNEVRPTTFGALGIELDVAATMRRLEAHASEGRLLSRLGRAWRAREGKVEVEPVWSFDANRAKTTLERIAPEVWRAPVDARLDLVHHERIVDEPGRSLDIDATCARIASGERDELATFVVATRQVPAAVTSAMISTIDVSKVLSSFETGFGGTGSGRGRNVARGAELLNGTVIAPGQTISFNKVVGPRVVERGFKWAKQIKDDEWEEGVGGGICQVATTVHAAAVFGALEVPERRSHSRPSAYAPMGLDATVIYGKVDLKLKNPYDSPLILHAFLPSPRKLRVELLGRNPPGNVEHTFAVTKVDDFFRRVTTKPFLGQGAQIRKQKGLKGYEVVSTVTVTHADGSVESRRYKSKYWPVPEVYWVGSGVTPATLPELPKGASYVEVDGSRDASSVGRPSPSGVELR